MSAGNLQSMPIIYHDEPKMYVSSMRLQLQLNNNYTRQNAKKLKLNAEDYEWHTMVLTSPAEINSKVNVGNIQKEKHHQLQEQQQQQQQQRQPVNNVNHTVREHHQSKIDENLKSDLDKFMLCERFHSEYQQQMQKQQQLAKEQQNKLKESRSSKMQMQTSNDMNSTIDKVKGNDMNKEKDTDKDTQKQKENVKGKEKEKEKGKDKDKNKDKDKGKSAEKEKEKEKEKSKKGSRFFFH